MTSKCTVLIGWLYLFIWTNQNKLVRDKVKCFHNTKSYFFPVYTMYSWFTFGRFILPKCTELGMRSRPLIDEILSSPSLVWRHIYQKHTLQNWVYVLVWYSLNSHFSIPCRWITLYSSNIDSKYCIYVHPCLALILIFIQYSFYNVYPDRFPSIRNINHAKEVAATLPSSLLYFSFGSRTHLRVRFTG